MRSLLHLARLLLLQQVLLLLAIKKEPFEAHLWLKPKNQPLLILMYTVTEGTYILLLL
jgi:hypothetical protein